MEWDQRSRGLRKVVWHTPPLVLVNWRKAFCLFEPNSQLEQLLDWSKGDYPKSSGKVGSVCFRENFGKQTGVLDVLLSIDDGL
jgi:hypothetical protein